jgi:hypothetical protein
MIEAMRYRRVWYLTDQGAPADHSETSVRMTDCIQSVRLNSGGLTHRLCVEYDMVVGGTRVEKFLIYQKYYSYVRG